MLAGIFPVFGQEIKKKPVDAGGSVHLGRASAWAQPTFHFCNRAGIEKMMISWDLDNSAMVVTAEKRTATVYIDEIMDALGAPKSHPFQVDDIHR